MVEHGGQSLLFIITGDDEAELDGDFVFGLEECAELERVAGSLADGDGVLVVVAEMFFPDEVGLEDPDQSTYQKAGEGQNNVPHLMNIINRVL